MSSRALYLARKAAGLCTSCGKREAELPRIYCGACRARARANHWERRRVMAEVVAESRLLEVELADMRKRSAVDDTTPYREDPVCQALIEAHGGMKLEHIAEVLMRRGETADQARARKAAKEHLSKERIRQIVDRAEAKARKVAERIAPDLLEHWEDRFDRRNHWDAIGEMEAVTW